MPGISSDRIRVSSRSCIKLAASCQTISIFALCVALTVLHSSHAAFADQSQTSRNFELHRLSRVQAAPAQKSIAASIDPDIRGSQLQAIARSRRLQSSSAQDSEPLVVKNHRFDPLNHFRKYKGGYDIRNKHYWASTLFTGVYGYVIAAAWLLAGIFATLIGCTLYCCRKKFRPARKQPGEYFPRRRLVSLLSATLVTALAIACCGVILAGNRRFHSRAKDVERTILVQGAQNATQTIYNVTSVMGIMKTEIEPYDESVANRLDSTTLTLNKAAISLIETVQSHKRTVDIALKVLDICVAAIVSTNLVVFVVGLAFVFALPKMKRFFYLIVGIAWLLIVLNWILFGVTFAVSNFADDTCEALKEYQQSTRNTTLDSLLPCGDLAAGNKTVFRIKEKIYKYIVEANNNISKLHIVAGVTVCNPFSGPPSYQSVSNCSTGTIPISDLPGLLSDFKCSNGTAKNTASAQCIPDVTYNTALAYIAAAQNLLTLIPEMESLTNCSFVVGTFSTIVKHQCKPAKSSIRMVWIPLVILSTLAIIDVVAWLTQIHYMSQKMNLPHGGAITPHDQPTSFFPEKL